MRTTQILSFAACWALATPLLPGQGVPLPPPPDGADAVPAPPADPVAPVPKAEPVGPRGVEPLAGVPLGKLDAEPVVRSAEELLKESETASVEADTFWLGFDHAGGAGETFIDCEAGLCFLLERRVIDGQIGPLVVRGGRGVPDQVRLEMLGQASRKSVLYAAGRGRIVGRAGAERMRLGVSARRGTSVHSSQSLPFDQYPAEVRAAATALLESARALPVASAAKGVVYAEFVMPQAARRMTVLQGQRLIGVRDPGKDEPLVAPAVMAARAPGRRIVVLDELQWEVVQNYLEAGGTAPDPRGVRSCLIGVGAATYRLFVETAGE